MRRNGLNKYDAPLRIQYQWGYDAFKRGGRFITVKSKNIFQESRPNLDPNTSSISRRIQLDDSNSIHV